MAYNNAVGRGIVHGQCNIVGSRKREDMVETGSYSEAAVGEVPVESIGLCSSGYSCVECKGTPSCRIRLANISVCSGKCKIGRQRQLRSSYIIHRGNMACCLVRYGENEWW